MFGQISEQLFAASQPASKLFAANVQVLQELASQNTRLITGVLDDSKKLVSSLQQQTEAKGVIAAHSVYVESLRGRVASTTKGQYGSLNAASQALNETMKQQFTQPATPTTATKPVAAKPATKRTKPKTVRKATTKKAAAKPAAPKTVAAAPAPKVVAPASNKEVAKSETVKASNATPVTAATSKAPASASVADKAPSNSTTKK